MEDAEKLHSIKGSIERNFYTSLNHLCNLYPLEISPTRHFPFPLNMVRAFQETAIRLKTIAPEIELIIVSDDLNPACLATVKTYSTGTTLFYIPVRPLADLLADAARQQEATQVLYIFAYLYHVVGIPWFLENGSFLEYTYGCMESWYMDTPEPEEEEATLEKLAIFQQMRTTSVVIEKQLMKKRRLRGWRKSLREFSPVDPAGKALKKVAQSIWKLHKSYPGKSILHSILPDLLFPEIEERLRVDYYLSFFLGQRRCYLRYIHGVYQCKFRGIWSN